MSKALTGKEGVSDSVRELIVKKAEEMGYHYTGSKKEKTGEGHNIGIIISEHFITKDAYYSRLHEKTMMMLAAGLETKKEWLIEDRDDEGDKIELILPKKMPTAFVCSSDAVAFDLVKKLQKEGYRVPEDVSVVGFDNFIYSEMSSPKITTYGVDTDAMVINAIRIILEKIENSNYSVGRVLVAGTLIERHSVKPLEA